MPTNCQVFAGPDFQVYAHQPRSRVKTGQQIEAGVIVCGAQPAQAPVIDTKTKRWWSLR